MQLADFLDEHTDAILAEWVTFAQRQPGAARMDLQVLRDHAAGMLGAIAADLRRAQSDDQQREKSFGEGPALHPGLVTAAESHGSGRAESGFSVIEMVAEFRALRASVLRLWSAERRVFAGDDVVDLARFHEAIDQALAESVAHFHTSVTQSHDLFLAVLGHDLRTPLQTMTLVSEFIATAPGVDATYSPLVHRAIRSGKRMERMLDDLLDFTRNRAGVAVNVEPYAVDLRPVIDQAVEEVRVIHGQTNVAVTVEAVGDLHGTWDAARLAQVLSNLLGNAVEHGARTAPVRVVALGNAPSEVVVAVRNGGPAIPPAAMPHLFNPFKRLRSGVPADGHGTHLGLGLFIANQIVRAHGGHVVVTSTDEEGTCFAVHLPRHRDPAPNVGAQHRLAG